MTMTIPLNPQQLQAVHHVEGPLLVLAGAGSGKTRIVTQRIAHLLEIGVPASEILALTFTNKAAEEMRSRVKSRTDQYVLTCTFHSLGARILRESIDQLGYSANFTIYDENDSIDLLKSILKSRDMTPEKSLIRSLRAAISNAKNQLLSPYQLDDPLIKEIYMLYRERLKQYNALDFDDLLYQCVILFREHPEVLQVYHDRWTFILIDEYQDTNEAQYVLTNLLAKKHRNICVVGDPDQSIYSWRGANIKNILNFENDYPDAVQINLEQNYRSTNHILKAANSLIEHNVNRMEKALWSDKGEGETIGIYIAETEKEEALFVMKIIKKAQDSDISLSDMVIFYRTNSQSRIFEDFLLKYQIPYHIVGGISFYQRREIKDILALLRMIVSPSDFLSFARTINVPKRGIGSKAIATLRDLADSERLPVLTLCERVVSGEIPCKISAKAKSGLAEYVSMMEFLKKQKTEKSLPSLMRSAIEQSRYLNYLKEDPETYEDRKENVDELISKAAEWEMENEGGQLEKFLEELTLKSSLDEANPLQDSLALMTLHNGKGLEFRIAIIVGLEEDLFPHINTKDSLDGIEEERRLCYVGMTRAKEQLYLTAAKYRLMWGTPKIMRPSRFFDEIPKEHSQILHATTNEEDSEAFPIGTEVMHKDFGRGIIRNYYQTSLGLTYDVYFEESKSMRTLIAKYAKLTRL